MADEFKDIIKQINEMKAENDKLNHLKSRYIEHAKVLLDIAEKQKALMDEIINLANKIDPVLTTSTRNKSDMNFDELTREFLVDMQNGEHITKKYIEEKYPHFTIQQINYLLIKVGKLQGVQKSYDGRCVRFFI